MAKDIPENIFTQDLQLSGAGSRYALAGVPEPASFILWGAHIEAVLNTRIHSLEMAFNCQLCCSIIVYLCLLCKLVEWY